MYINDIVRAINYFNVRIFAGDTSLAVSGPDPDILIQQMNMEVQNIYDWLSSNK